MTFVLIVYIIFTTMAFIRKIKKAGKTYLAEVENVRVDGKVVQRHIRYIGKEVDNKTILSSSISNITIDKIKLHGPLLALNYLSEDIGLSETLGEYGKEILSLVFAHCIDYKSINKMSKWFERTDLNLLLDLESLTEDRLLKALDSLAEMDQEKLQKDIFNRVRKRYTLDTKRIIYDVTNTYLYGRKCPFGKLGKDKEGVKGRPLIQIGLGVTRKEGIPIFHKTFNGNISDSRTLHDLITSFHQYNIKSGLIVYDRGITSEKNIKAVKELNWGTICGLASNNNLKSILKKTVDGKKLSDINKRIKMNKTVFYVFSQLYSIGEVKGKLLICYNEQKNKDLRESRYDEILNAQALLEKGEEMKEGMEKFFQSNGSLDHKAVSKAEEGDGFSFVFCSNSKMSNIEIMQLYFHDKDIVEKAFQSLKGVVKIQPIRHWLYDRVKAHIFICYLSYLLLSLLKLKMKKIGISPVEALSELDSLYKVYMRDQKKDFKVEKTIALTKVQEKILKAIDKSLLSKCSV